MKTERFKAAWSKDGSLNPAKRGESQPTTNLEVARADAERAAMSNRSVTILREDTGEYCAENAGKWFLHLIIK